MGEPKQEVPVDVRMQIVERNIAVAMQQIFDCSINIEAANLGAKDDKDTPEATRLRVLAADWIKKRDYFQGKMKELEAEKTK